MADVETQPTGPDIRVFIVDDHPLVRDSMRDLFEHTDGLCACGEAGARDEALRKIPEAKPDLVVLDLGLGDSSGFEVLRDLHTQYPGIRVLVLSMFDEGRYALRALREGARGYVMKTARAEEILSAVFQAGRDKLVVSEAVHQQLLANAADGVDETQTPDQLLSRREWQVFELLGQGCTVKEAAERLKVSEKTINSYCERIKMKLKMNRLRDIAQLAHDWIRDNAL